MITQVEAKHILNIYKQAWEDQDSDLILKIFNNDAIYHEKTFEQPYVGHNGIKQYWEDKVVKQQSNIKFKLLSLYIDGNTIIAEWDSEFDDIKLKARKHIREVAIIELKDNKISHLREYWASRIID